MTQRKCDHFQHNSTKGGPFTVMADPITEFLSSVYLERDSSGDQSQKVKGGDGYDYHYYKTAPNDMFVVRASCWPNRSK